MPKIRWTNLPPSLRQHLFDRVADRQISAEDLCKLKLWRGEGEFPTEYEKEIHEAVPGSRYVKLSGAGHFPPTEIPDEVNALIEEFVATL